MKQYLLDGFFKFIDESASSFHTVNNVIKMLEISGFQRLKEDEDWKLECGRAYYVTRNDSSIAAFKIPDQVWSGFHIVASHSDFPCFKLKENPEMTVDEQYVKLNTEKYGGMILSTWLDRPLSVAGRVVIDGKTGLETKLVRIDRDLMIIPNVAIHMIRDMNKGMEYNPQIDMLPLLGGIESKGRLYKLIAEQLDIEAEDILGSDLYVYNRDRAKLIGAGREYVAAPRLDDLQCAYASVQGLLQAKAKDAVAVSMIFDNEEVGSSTRQGAGSTFLKDCLKGICGGLGKDEKEYRRMLPSSFLVSADNAHGVHPNHTEKADPTNRPYLNGGIVIKHHGSQKYTTDAYSAAYVKKICSRIDVPYQSYANRSDIAGGSTLGNISAGRVSIPSADIGLAQLSMHSACETAGVKDLEYLMEFFIAFYGEKLFSAI